MRLGDGQLVDWDLGGPSGAGGLNRLGGNLLCPVAAVKISLGGGQQSQCDSRASYSTTGSRARGKEGRVILSFHDYLL